MLACHVFVFFGKVSVQIFDSIFNQVACFLIVGLLKSFCIFWISPLSDVSSANIFSQPVAFSLSSHCLLQGRRI